MHLIAPLFYFLPNIVYVSCAGTSPGFKVGEAWVLQPPPLCWRPYLCVSNWEYALKSFFSIKVSQLSQIDTKLSNPLRISFQSIPERGLSPPSPSTEWVEGGFYAWYMKSNKKKFAWILEKALAIHFWNSRLHQAINIIIIYIMIMNEVY